MHRFGKMIGGWVVAVVLVATFSAFTPTPPPNRLTLIFDGQIVTLDEATLQGGWFNYDSKQALTQGKNLFSRATAMQETDTFAGTFPDIVHYLDRVATKYEIAPYDGQVNFFPHQTPRFTVSHQTNGRELDRERLYADILTALKGNAYPTVTAHFRDVAPQAPEQIIAGIKQRSQFSTKFTENPGRENNIRLASGKFNGLVIRPGEEVSFNAVVGPRTAKQGFAEAKIIIDGEYVDGVGGGVCQVSTTIFNAVAQAGLQIVEAHNHSLPSSYVPLGHDAMVSSGTDLRFTNNTGAPVYLETAVRDHRLTVTVYGRDQGPNIQYRLTTQTIKELPPQDAWMKDLPETTKKDYQKHPERYTRRLVTTGQKGQVVETYLETWQGDRRLSRKRLRRATYRARPHQYTLDPTPATLSSGGGTSPLTLTD